MDLIAFGQTWKAVMEQRLVCVCVYIYAYTYTYIHTYMSLSHVSLSIYMYTHTYTHARERERERALLGTISITGWSRARPADRRCLALCGLD